MEDYEYDEELEDLSIENCESDFEQFFEEAEQLIESEKQIPADKVLRNLIDLAADARASFMANEHMLADEPPVHWRAPEGDFATVTAFFIKEGRTRLADDKIRQTAMAILKIQEQAQSILDGIGKGHTDTRPS